MSIYLDLEDLMLDPFWNNQDEMLNTWHMINNHSCVPIVYGRATEAEAHARPTTDLLKTFRGPFKEIMQSKAMRWISQEDLDKHNYKAKQVAIEWFVLDPTLQGTKPAATRPPCAPSQWLTAASSGGSGVVVDAKQSHASASRSTCT